MPKMKSLELKGTVPDWVGVPPVRFDLRDDGTLYIEMQGEGEEGDAGNPEVRREFTPEEVRQLKQFLAEDGRS